MQQRGVLRLEPSRGVAAFGSVVVMIVTAAVSGTALAFHAGAWSDTTFAIEADPPAAMVLGAAGFFGFIALLACFSAFHNALRWSTQHRIKRLSSNPSVVALIPSHRTTVAQQRAVTVPALDVRHRKEHRHHKAPKPLHRVTAEANVIGRRPLQIVYLRLFDNQPRIRTFVESAWREFGYVHFLRSATAVTRREYNTARRQNSFDRLFVSSDDELIQTIRSAPRQPIRPGRHRFDHLGPSRIRTRDKYGAYPVRALLCHGSYWQRAVDVLLSQVDIAVIDLSGFTDRNAGTAYELQRVIDRFPIERTVIMCDPKSSTKLITSAVHTAWMQMDAHSPNAVGHPRAIPVVATDRYWRSTSTNDNQQDQVRLVSVRRHSRRFVAATQLSIHGERIPA